MNTLSTIASIAIVVPAHNEETLLESSLISIHAAAERAPLPVEVIVVADQCTDRTAEIAAQFGPVVQIADRNVGAARRAGFRAVTSPHTAWMVTTDADSVVPVDWLTDQMTYARAGVELVAGTVRVVDWDTYSSRTRFAYERRYRTVDPSTRIHGCNLSFLGSRYLSVGGFAPLALHEDVDLVHRFVRAGAHVVWSDRSPVVTSGRRKSRADGGFAAHLSSLDLAR